MNQYLKVSMLCIAISLAACSTSMLETDKVDYKSVGKAPSLDIPPDLTQLSRDTPYTVVGSSISASGYQANQAALSKTSTATLSVGDVRIERAGNQRWLVVNRPAEKLWDPVKSFWLESGFLLTIDQSGLGIMETEWAENRAKIPKDAIRAILSKVVDNLFSTGERDKFRTRLERDANGNTEIYISHRGMMEVYPDEGKDKTVWQPRPTDPELEAEFLRRLMVRLGSTPEQASSLIANSKSKSITSVSDINGQPVALIEDGFERTWRRVGLALDRTGFTVEDRDRKQGIYFVRYVPPTEASQQGFFSRLFSKSPEAASAAKYQIAVRAQGERTVVSVLNAQGSADTSENAKRIVQVIADDIK